MTVGYGYLLDSDARDAKDKTDIADMDLAGIRKYMCPISNGDYKRCENCQGRKKCRVGQRVTELLAKRAEQQERSKWQEALGGMPETRAASINIDDARQKILRDACESGNAWGYIMHAMGQTKNAAKETLIQLIRKYPAIAAEYGGSRRIIQRPSVAMIESTQDAPDKPTVPAAEEAQDPQEDGKTGNTATEINTKSNQGRRDAAVKLYLECMQHDDPIAYYMEQRGATRNAARIFLGRMSKREGIAEAQEQAVDATEKPEETEHPEEPEEQAGPETGSGADTDEDTISLEDFLLQYSANQEPEPEPDPSAEELVIPEIDPDGGEPLKDLALSVIREAMENGSRAERLQAAALYVDYIKIGVSNG